MGFRSRCGKMARQRHLYTFSGVCLELSFTYMYENQYTYVHNNTYKTVSRYKIRKPNRKSVILNCLVIFCVIFAIFRCHTLTNSSQRCIQMNTKIGHCNLKPFVTLNCEDLFRCFAMKQEVVITKACYVRPSPNFTGLIRLLT